MRKLTIFAAAGCLLAHSLAAVAAEPTDAPAVVSEPAPVAAAPAAAPASSPAPGEQLFIVGAGAVMGIVVFNMLTYPFGAVPFVAAAFAPTPMDIALGSRIIAGITSGIGAITAHYLYTSQAQ